MPRTRRTERSSRKCDNDRTHWSILIDYVRKCTSNRSGETVAYELVTFPVCASRRTAMMHTQSGRRPCVRACVYVNKRRLVALSLSLRIARPSHQPGTHGRRTTPSAGRLSRDRPVGSSARRYAPRTSRRIGDRSRETTAINPLRVISQPRHASPVAARVRADSPGPRSRDARKKERGERKESTKNGKRKSAPPPRRLLRHEAEGDAVAAELRRAGL